MSWKIRSNIKHTFKNGYRCADQSCPCQSAGDTDVTISPTSTWPLLPGSTSCAWCNKEAGRPQGNGSHGICKRHAAQLIAQAKARRAQ